MPGWFGALIYYHTGDFMNLLKLVLECPVECGRWGQILFGQCPNAEYMNPYGSSLQSVLFTTIFIIMINDQINTRRGLKVKGTLTRRKLDLKAYFWQYG